MYKRKYFAFDVKSIDDETGVIKGYGSVYGNLDLKGDVMQPGVFTKSLAAWKDKGKLPPMLWQHQSANPVGPYTTMREDNKGLYTEGQLLIKDVPQAKIAHALLKSGAISGQSVGYNTKDEDYDPKGGIWNVKEADLWECSVVTFPANTEALIDEVKSGLHHGTLPTIRIFEDFLREAGFSKTVALEIASKGYAPILKRRESDEGKSAPRSESGALDSVLDLIATKQF
jgi:HK97 family phage prohead protease